MFTSGHCSGNTVETIDRNRSVDTPVEVVLCIVEGVGPSAKILLVEIAVKIIRQLLTKAD